MYAQKVIWSSYPEYDNPRTYSAHLHRICADGSRGEAIPSHLYVSNGLNEITPIYRNKITTIARTYPNISFP